jgi:hypothetical protein
MQLRRCRVGRAFRLSTLYAGILAWRAVGPSNHRKAIVDDMTTCCFSPSLFCAARCPSPPMASVFNTLPQLRTAAPRLSRRLFSCSQCLNSPIRSAVPASTRSSRPSVLHSVRWKSTQPLRTSAAIEHASAGRVSLAEATTAAEGKSSSFPKTTSKSVAYWLLGSAASVFGIVVFGGLTRLTESG